MLFRELNRGKCKTYLVACEATRQAALIDPVKDRVDRYHAVLANHRCEHAHAVDTHTHADHRTGTWELRELTGARVVMHRRAPAPHVDVHVDEGTRLAVGELTLTVLATPGHTPDGISLYVGDRVFTGDTLLIHGTGRADFAGGDPGAQWDSITQKVFALPDETLVFPAHDYRGHTHSTIGEEKRANPRLAGRSRAAYVELMNNLGLPLPDNIQEALQSNQSAIEDGSVAFPALADLSRVRQVAPHELRNDGAARFASLSIDVVGGHRLVIGHDRQDVDRRLREPGFANAAVKGIAQGSELGPQGQLIAGADGDDRIRGLGRGVFLVQALHQVVDLGRADAAHQRCDALAGQRFAGRMPDEQDRLQDATGRNLARRVVRASHNRDRLVGVFRSN
jgi:glyoxylase-like metal-dependent hydrolase (beta-lactamase superfamily II)